MLFRIHLAMTAIILLVACGKDRKDKVAPNSPPLALQSPEISSFSDDPTFTNGGRWASECKPCGKSFCQEVLEISKDSLTWIDNQYEDSLCEEPQMRLLYLSEYEAREGRLIARLVQTRVLLKDENVRAVAEQSESCGFNSWPLNTMLDITGKRCPNTFESGGIWARWLTPGKLIFSSDYVVEGPTLTLKTATGVTNFQWAASDRVR